ncbi:hypothetical protein Btru_052161 [Bulinus truncatus]|nr:hypothetical protein Btru_052161 [Bulinus truncatus]
MFDLSAAPEMVKRDFQVIIMDVQTAAQTNQTKASRLIQIQSDMATIHATAKVYLNETDNTRNCLQLKSGYHSTHDFDEQKTVWKGWRDATGKKMKHLYPEYVELMNEAHRILGFNDTSEYWRSWYETPTFIEDIESLWEQIRPLYEQLHAYTRRKLKYIYGNDKFPPSGHIPGHILDSKWSGFEKELLPFPDKGIFDVTEEMVRQVVQLLVLL